MRRSTRNKAIYLAVSVLLCATLACNISNPQGQAEPVTVDATATEAQAVEAPSENDNPDNAQPTPIPSPSGDSNDSGDGGGSGETDILESAGENFSITSEGIILANVSIKNGNESFEGHIAYPSDNTNDELSIKPIDFDSEKTSGSLIFTMDCSGRGKAKINYKGGAVTDGSPGCGETWTIAVINGSPDSHILIRLDASGDINWTLTVTSGE